MHSDDRATDDLRPTLQSGVRVQVRGPRTGAWIPGFQIVAGWPRGYVVRRLSDRAVIRRLFAESDVRVDPIPMPLHCWTPGNAG